MTELKVNLHITQKCNFHCRYCFAKFESQKDLSGKDWKCIIDNLANSGMVGSLNFAGGEPVLHPDFPDMVSYAFEKGFRLSLISNGTLLMNEKLFPRELFSRFDMLGVSVDSLEPKTLRALGCCDGMDNVLREEDIVTLIRTAKVINPQLVIKLNTVVTDLNKGEQLTQLEKYVPVDRWKFLKMKPFRTDNFSNFDLRITDDDFSTFLQHNARRGGESVPEYSMVHSYIIVDNSGKLIDNGSDDSYTAIGNLLVDDFKTVFSKYAFDRKLYQERYVPQHTA